MKLRSFPFLFGEALRNLRRHALMTVAAISAIAVALILVGSFVLALYEAHGATQHVAGDFEMRVFVRLDVSRPRALLLEKRVAALPGVSTVDFLPREKVFAEQAKDSALNIDGIPNLMPDTLNVRLADASSATNIVRELRSYPEVESVQAMEEELQTLLRLGRVAKTVGIAAGAILLFAALAVVANTIRLSVFSRRREIKIMQIVGASAAFIRLPLLIEGLLHGISGGSIAALALWGIGQYIGDLFRGTLPQFASYSEPVDFVTVSAYLIWCGAIMGGTGSVMAIRRYLRA